MSDPTELFNLFLKIRVLYHANQVLKSLHILLVLLALQMQRMDLLLEIFLDPAHRGSFRAAIDLILLLNVLDPKL